MEYTKIGILDYFKRMNALKYLKEKPESAHNPGTKTRNRYGVHMNKQVKALLEDLKRNKPPSSKGVFIKKVFLSSTMGAGLEIDLSSLRY